MIDVVNNWLVFPLFGISKLHHAYSSSGAIEVVKEFVVHLISTVNTLGWKVSVPIKGIPLEGLNKLFDQ